MYHRVESENFTLKRGNYIKEDEQNGAQILRGGTVHPKLKCLKDVLLYIAKVLTLKKVLRTSSTV